jgi:EVE domain
VRAWLGVVSAAHVRRGVALGIAQIGHGRKDGLTRMRPGDWLVYYSPREEYREGPPLQAFTAIGEVADEEVWQADEGVFKPWRRRVRYAEATETPLAALAPRLELTQGKGWGARLRRGLVELSAADFERIRAAMLAP